MADEQEIAATMTMLGDFQDRVAAMILRETFVRAADGGWINARRIVYLSPDGNAHLDTIAMLPKVIKLAQAAPPATGFVVALFPPMGSTMTDLELVSSKE